MQKNIEAGPKLVNAKSKLSKYVSIRKEASQKFKKTGAEDDDDDM